MNLTAAKAWLLLVPVAGAAVAYVAVRLWRGLRKLVFVLNDILGSPEKPSLYDLVVKQGEQLKAIDKELHPNGGSSMRDQIVRVEKQVGEVRTDAAEAKQRAADAASEAEGLSGALARFHHDAQQRADIAARERRGVQETLDVLTKALMDYASQGRQRESAYVRALHTTHGIDLTKITDELDEDIVSDER